MSKKKVQKCEIDSCFTGVGKVRLYRVKILLSLETLVGASSEEEAEEIIRKDASKVLKNEITWSDDMTAEGFTTRLHDKREPLPGDWDIDCLAYGKEDAYVADFLGLCMCGNPAPCPAHPDDDAEIEV